MMTMALTNETLKLSANMTGAGAQWWMAKGSEPARGPGDYPKISVARNDTGDFTFTIINPATMTFAQTNPFGPKAGANNPSDFWDQFTVVSGAGMKKLVVHDANANKAGGPYNGGDYYYELHFNDGSTLDPVITNGGCCHSFANANTVTYLALGVVALAVLYILLVRPMMARNTRVDSDQG